MFALQKDFHRAEQAPALENCQPWGSKNPGGMVFLSFN